MVAVIPHDENLVFLQRQRELGPVGGVGGLLDIGLVQGLAVHIDGAGQEVDVHRLAAHGNDPLDQRLIQLGVVGVHHHHIPGLEIAEQGIDHHDPVPCIEGILHGRAADADQPDQKGKQQHHAHHRGHKRPRPVIDRVFQGLPLLHRLRLSYLFLHGGSLLSDNILMI